MGQTEDKKLHDLTHERAVWKVEHWGWATFALIILAALTGLFGQGPVARAKAQNSQIVVEYDRFVRYQAPAHLKVHLRNGGGSSMPALWIGREFLDRVEVERISPEPERVKLAKDGLIYIFDMAQTNESAKVTVDFKPAGYGNTRVALRLVDGSQVQFTQFFYP